jgi:hypothetical protein
LFEEYKLISKICYVKIKAQISLQWQMFKLLTMKNWGY